MLVKRVLMLLVRVQIDEILSTKAVDRRVIFEEAAGVLKYKKRKEDAIKRLDKTSINLNRVSDIIGELEGDLIDFL